MTVGIQGPCSYPKNRTVSLSPKALRGRGWPVTVRFYGPCSNPADRIETRISIGKRRTRVARDSAIVLSQNSSISALSCTVFRSEGGS